MFELASGSEGDAGALIVKEVIVRVFEALPAVSVTMIVQSEYVPTARVSRVIELVVANALVVALLQLPPYVIVPSSLEVNEYVGVVSVAVAITASSEIVGAVVSIVITNAVDADEVFPAVSVSLNVIEFDPEASVPVVRENTDEAQVVELPEDTPSS